MLRLRTVRENPDGIRRALARRGKPDETDALLDKVLECDEERRAVIRESDALKAQRNTVSLAIAASKKSGEDASDSILAMRTVGDRIKLLDARIAEIEEQSQALLLGIPNVPADDLPQGGEEANRVVRSWGTPRTFDFQPRPHWELGEALGILDLPRGAKIAGTAFPLLRGAGARLERGLINFMLDLHTGAHGYEEIWPPYLVNRDSITATGQLPKFEGDQYRIEEDDLFLIPTGEVPVTNIYRDEILPESALPIRMTAFTPCFRREAGAAGVGTRGLTRVHQFDKVELVRLERPEDSDAALEELLNDAARILEKLGLAYRVLLLASGDIGFSSHKTYDLEVWSPGLGRWLEISSCSTFRDYQAIRGNIRFRRHVEQQVEFVHTLNGSALAVGRTLLTLLEVYQNADGSIDIPEVLEPYVGMRRLVPPA